MIDALYEASHAGVEIDLIVRGICCLRPGVPGLSETHPRALASWAASSSTRASSASAARRAGARYYIGSADLMTRNLDRRVEVLVPVEDAGARARLDEILAVNLDDDVLAWELEGSGRWRRLPETNGFSTHTRFQELARAQG